MTPSKIHLHKKSGILDIHFGSAHYALPAEFLRVHSPSAEVKGHAGAGGQLPYGKKSVGIISIQPSGNYAVKIAFDDGHNSGLYTWNYLKTLCENQDTLWHEYIDQLHEQGLSREGEAQVLQFVPPQS